MKTVALVLCVAVAASASPQFFFRRPAGQATGFADANVVSATNSGPFQNTGIRQVSSSAGGSTRGNAISNNRGSASNINTNGFFGSTDVSQTSAESNQQSGNSIGFGRPFRRRGGRPFRRGGFNGRR